MWVYALVPVEKLLLCIHSVKKWAATNGAPREQCVGTVTCSGVPQCSRSVDSDPRPSDRGGDHATYRAIPAPILALNNFPVNSNSKVTCCKCDKPKSCQKHVSLCWLTWLAWPATIIKLWSTIKRITAIQFLSCCEGQRTVDKLTIGQKWEW